jgi:hypothetical protein
MAAVAGGVGGSGAVATALGVTAGRGVITVPGVIAALGVTCALGVATAGDGVAAVVDVPVACGPDSPTGSLAPWKMNFTVPPELVRFSWHLTGWGSDSVPSLQ